MPDEKISQKTLNSTPIGSDQVPIVDDPTGTPETQRTTIENLVGYLVTTAGDILYATASRTLARLGIGTAGQVLTVNGAADGVEWTSKFTPDRVFSPGGRLTLTTATPVTIADVTAATTIYYTPYMHDSISLYDGSSWTVYQFTEKSVSVPATTTTPFDIFGYASGGALALETLDWTNDTTRATALALQDGRLVKSGAATRLYLGTGRTTSVSGQTEDSDTSRFLWNMYNRRPRFQFCSDTTNTWAYTIATWRAQNADTTVGVGRVDFVIGVAETLVEAVNYNFCVGASGIFVGSGVGIDSTSVNSAQMTGARLETSAVPVGTYKGYPAVGYHYAQRLEVSTASGTTNWYGDNGVTYVQSGMHVQFNG